jgi:ubiquinone/menaquinone biosynthesis C-methylase UbiE
VPSHGHRIFAAFYDVLCHQIDKKGLARYREKAAGGATGRVIEIGAGTGRNFSFYAAIDRLTATEPDPHMLRRAVKKTSGLPFPLLILPDRAEALSLPDQSADSVVATLVFCTVADPAAALREIRRVLTPEGSFRFVEHVRAEGPRRAWLQDFLTPLHRRIAAGCHPNRDTVRLIEREGFRLVELERFPLGPPWVRPHVFGVAVPRPR